MTTDFPTRSSNILNEGWLYITRKIQRWSFYSLLFKVGKISKKIAKIWKNIPFITTLRRGVTAELRFRARVVLLFCCLCQLVREPVFHSSCLVCCGGGARRISAYLSPGSLRVPLWFSLIVQQILQNCLLMYAHSVQQSIEGSLQLDLQKSRWLAMWWCIY